MISGEWLESETDFIVKGPEPLVLARSYSANYSLGKLGYNWEFNRPHKLIVKSYYSSEGKKEQWKACLTHSTGIKTLHEARNSKHSITHLPLSETRGLTNCRCGEISGRTNLHNICLKIDTKKDYCEAITGSGHVTRYHFDYKDIYGARHYFPEYERAVNGNLILFQDHQMTACNADESLEYGWIRLNHENEQLLTVKTNEDQQATYTFNCYNYQEPAPPLEPENPHPKKQKSPKSKRYCLTQVQYTHKPQIDYEYDPPAVEEPVKYPPNPLLKIKKWPDNRFQEVDYYQLKENFVDGLNSISISKERDYRLGRVKEIKAPVGPDSTPLVTHRFIYLADDISAANKGKPYSGKTEVYNANMNKTVYAYNKEQRPISISRYANDGSLYSQENFIWDQGESKKKSEHLSNNASLPTMITEKSADNFISYVPTISNIDSLKQLISHQDILKYLKSPPLLEGQTSQEGNLLGKYLQDGQRNIQHGLFLTYDPKGNILKETFYGNLTGTCTVALKLDKNQKPQEKGVEKYEKTFTYSQDAFNHLLSEKEDNGKTIEYVYDSDTQQVSAKYIKENDHIVFRQFFFYDPQTSSLIKLIKDDGSSRDFNNVTDVEERLIQEMTLYKQYPVGLPKTIKEKYWDPLTQKEVLLKKIKNHYTKGYLTQQDHYDAEKHYCYSLYWEYDAHGNLKKEINAEGDTILKDYDANDNLILEIGPHPDEQKHYGYDYSNRLVSVTLQINQETWTTQYRYDLCGNRIATIDHFGQETTYEYDEFNRLIRTIYPSRQVSRENVIHPQSETSYDCNHYPIPHRENCVCEIYYDHIEWAEISQEEDVIMIQFYPHPSLGYWEFPLEIALEILQKAKIKFLGN